MTANNNSINLSTRLQKVAAFLPNGANFADIGSDHAYLPCYVCLQDQTAHAIAGEVNEGPYYSALETVERYMFAKRIEVRLGNGLSVLQKDEVNQVVIAGMGGALIRTILDEGKQSLDTVQRIIAQPNIDERSVRYWFYENGYTISNEAILEENGHIYEIIVADRKADGSQYIPDLFEKQLLFGPILLNEKSDIFIQKWKHERNKRRRVLDEMKKATEKDKQKISAFEKELLWIEEVLGDDNSNPKS
ncbi:tRNA (adenine(22)-N(1))-methyltransferase [Virgibacillus doumboii]|uniref:tRNA (adenine(22)-N(1))-methyltransferase n=1 Tax=Virgibacillus doumboii TaxID=2697503 RepID=UPI0013DF464D|nr:tRNA (adenine(22)-N(1))-methyltransferase TrmK [Virgibacillus doumboii]